MEGERHRGVVEKKASGRQNVLHFFLGGGLKNGAGALKGGRNKGRL